MTHLDPLLLLSLALVCFLIGVVLGFIGAGGAGVLVALLTSAYHLPVHQAIGTALATMCFVSVSGAVSHFREGNVAPRAGLAVGAAGAFGAILGANISTSIPEATLQIAAGLGLWVLAGLMWVRIAVSARLGVEPEWAGEPNRSVALYGAAAGLGAVGGTASAFLGVGMAPFLQLGFLSVLRLPLRIAVGTTMFALVFIAATGSVALARTGNVSPVHLIGATIGLMAGAFIGAKFTKRAPRWLLRSAVILVPFIAGAILLFG